MSENQTEPLDSLSATQAEQLNDVCERFETKLIAGLHPLIEDYLGEVPEAMRRALFCELLATEVEWLKRSGHQPDSAVYRNRFPEYPDQIEAACKGPITARAQISFEDAELGRKLLLGVLALVNGAVDRATFQAALDTWIGDKSRSITDILAEKGHITRATKRLLEATAQEPLEIPGTLTRSDRGRFLQMAPTQKEPHHADASSVDDTLAYEYTLGAESAGETPVEPGPGVLSSGQRFRIVRRCAEGGLGVIYVAQDHELPREVAVKEIKPRFARDTENQARFVLEAEVTGCLEHPGIVPVYSLGRYPDGRPYYAMRLIRGETLKDAVGRFHGDEPEPNRAGERLLELRHLLRRFIDVCNTVAYAHSRGVIHRDIKPHNIMLGPYGETLVVDWGLAKVVGREVEKPESEEATFQPGSAGSSDATLPGLPVGTLPYMGPEQAAGHLDLVGTSSDVYSLGATLYHVLTGKAPFETRNQDELIRRIREGDFPRPRQVRRDVPAPLEAICLKAMAAERRERYKSPSELANDIERWLADEPVGAFREPLSMRGGRWLRRHKSVVAVAIALLAAAAMGFAIDDVRVGREETRVVEARQDSNRSFAMAREAVDRLLEHVAETELPAVPQAEELRRLVADEAIGYYDRFLSRYPSDPQIMLDASKIYREAANINRLLGRFDKQVESQYNMSIRLLTELGHRNPRKLFYRASLALTLSDKGDWMRMNGRLRTAEALFRNSLGTAEKLLALSTDLPEHWLVKAISLGSLAETFIDRGRYQQALAASEEAAKILKALSAFERKNPFHRLLEIDALKVQGEALRHLGRPRDSLAVLEESIRLCEEWLRVLPTGDAVPPGGLPAHGLAANVRFLGARAQYEKELAIRATSKNSPDAERGLTRSLESLNGLVQDYPGIAAYRLALAKAYLEHGSQLIESGKIPQGREQVLAARHLTEKLAKDFPENLIFRGTLGMVLARLGRLAVEERNPAGRELLLRSVSELELASKENPDSPTYSRELKACKAQLAQGAPRPPEH